MEELSKEELLAMESQLSCPSGQQGIEMGEAMHETNIGMTTASLELLDVQTGNHVLELGHGNAAHLQKLIKMAEQISYCGLDISETMHKEAVAKNKHLLDKQQISFQLYDGQQIPFEDNSFDRIFTVNTVYFWQQPVALLKELNRVLKPSGICVVAFAQKAFMQQLPFVQSRFTLYDNEDIQKLADAAHVKLAYITDRTEKVKTKTGELVDREFSMARFEKV